MDSKCFKFNDGIAFLSFEVDVLFRYQAKVVFWVDEQPEAHDNGWWHWMSLIIDMHRGVTVYDEVTSFGYEEAGTVEFDDDLSELDDQGAIAVAIRALNTLHPVTAIDATEVESLPVGDEEFKANFPGIYEEGELAKILARGE
jgi:hypothetical protein